MYHEHRHWGLFFFRIIEILITVNIILVDTFVFRNILSPSTKNSTSTVLMTPTPTDVLSISPSPTSSQTTANPTTIINQTIGAKEIFIPVGQGQVTATDWTNIPGAVVYIDSTKYTNVKQVVFEASLQSPNNQIISVRLYNMTDNHPVWYSEMSTNGTSQFLTSQPIQLDNGNKLYQVQMKSQLQYAAIVDQARIHITLE